MNKLNKRFPVLSLVATLLSVVGVVVLIAAVVYVVYESLIEPNLPDHRFGKQDALQGLVGLGVVISSLLVMAIGELIGVLFAIEDNTRQIAGNTKTKG